MRPSCPAPPGSFNRSACCHNEGMAEADIACAIIENRLAGEVVLRTPEVIAFLDHRPVFKGHVLVCPYRHVADYTDLTAEETVEIAQMSQKMMRVIRAASSPHGFNLGMNQGSVAGAGIAAHLHQHIVPRWGGDANFFPIIAETKALPLVHGQVQKLYSEEWNRQEPHNGDADL